MGCLGTLLGVIDALGWERTFFLVPTGIELWWWAPFFAGLTLMGLAALPS